MNCARLSVEAEETFGKRTPWDSVQKLQDLVKKTMRNADTIDWVLMCINDLVLNQAVLRLSLADLTGKGTAAGKGTG